MTGPRAWWETTMQLLRFTRPDQERRVERSEAIAVEAERVADELVEKAVRAAMLRTQVDAATGRRQWGGR